MKVKTPRRLKVEDFPKEQAAAMAPIITAWNEFIDDYVNVMNKKLDFNNINMQKQTVDVETDGSGDLVNSALVRMDLVTRPLGIVCLNAIDRDDSSEFPTANPAFNFTYEANLLKILNISSLGNSKRYRLTILIVGDSIS